MVRRRVAELWRLASVGVDAQLTDWARLYRDLPGQLGTLATDRALSSEALREHLMALIEAHRDAKPRTPRAAEHEPRALTTSPSSKVQRQVPWARSFTRRFAASE